MENPSGISAQESPSRSIELGGLLRKFVAHLVPFGRQIRGVVLVGRTNNRDLIDDRDVEPPKVEGFGFFGIVG